jgi:hypothetical protein
LSAHAILTEQTLLIQEEKAMTVRAAPEHTTGLTIAVLTIAVAIIAGTIAIAELTHVPIIKIRVRRAVLTTSLMEIMGIAAIAHAVLTHRPTTDHRLIKVVASADITTTAAHVHHHSVEADSLAVAAVVAEASQAAAAEVEAVQYQVAEVDIAAADSPT